MTSARTESTSALVQPELRLPDVTVRNWPLVDAGFRWSASVILGTLAVGGLARWQSATWLMSLLAMLVVMVTMWRFWVPVEFHIHRRGVEEQCLAWRRSLTWRSVVGCRIDGRSAVLRCQFDRAGDDLSAFRYLEWPADRRDVAEALAFYCGTTVDAASNL